MATARVSLITSEDLIQQLQDQAGGADASGLLQRKCRRALQQGLQEVSAHRKWNYDRKSVVLVTNDQYDTGTITYTNSTLTVALASGTFPSWAGRAWILIGNISYRVATRSSGTALILDSVNNPGANVAAGTKYTLYTLEYLLPFDCSNILTAWNASSRFRLAGVTPDNFEDQVATMYEAGTPQFFTVTGDPWVKGAMCIKFYPTPSDAQKISYIYDKVQQPLRVWKYNTGTVAISASATALTGTSTVFTSSMVGSVVRFGTTTTEPTSLEGASPYLEERVILSVDSATTLTLDQAVDSAYSAVKYYVSDLVDVEPSAMKTAVLNCAALHFARERNADSSELSRRTTAYVDALRLAMQADRRFTIEDYGLGHRYGGFPTAHTPTNAGYFA